VKVYLDFSVLSALVVQTARTATASELIRAFPAPYTISSLHLLQVENLLKRLADEDRQLSRAALAFWQRQLSEEVFELLDPDWSAVFYNATALQRNGPRWPGFPLQVLHVSAARLLDAQRFATFEAEQRSLARRAGLRLLPERL
jgi:hypothetical protein